MLAITGHHFHDLIETHSQQDIDLDRLFMDVAVYNVRVMGPEHVEGVTHLACRAAIGRRGVAHINFPVDTQSQPVKKHSQRNVPGHSSAVLGRRAGCPAEEDLQHKDKIKELI